jgi:hypothetical protein
MYIFMFIYAYDRGMSVYKQELRVIWADEHSSPDALRLALRLVEDSIHGVRITCTMYVHVYVRTVHIFIYFYMYPPISLFILHVCNYLFVDFASSTYMYIYVYINIKI